MRPKHLPRRYWIGTVAVVAICAGIAFATTASGTSNLVAPHLGWGQFRSPNYTYQECQQDGPGVLRAEGFGDVERAGRYRSWYGRMAGGPMSAVIVCLGTAEGAWVTITVGHPSDESAANRMAERIRKRMFAKADDTPDFTSGVYSGVQVTGGTRHNSTWRLTVKAGKVTGTSEWQCCPGARTDPITGTVRGDTVVLVRDCTGQGQSGACSQTATGRVTRQGNLTGTWTGSGCSEPCTFTLTKRD